MQKKGQADAQQHRIGVLIQNHIPVLIMYVTFARIHFIQSHVNLICRPSDCLKVIVQPVGKVRGKVGGQDIYTVTFLTGASGVSVTLSRKTH